VNDMAATYSGSVPTIRARVAKGGMEIAGVEVLDISIAGCMLQWNGWRLKEEDRVRVSFPTLNNLPATVLWSEQDRLGLLFTQPLHEAVYEHLIKG